MLDDSNNPFIVPFISIWARTGSGIWLLQRTLFVFSKYAEWKWWPYLRSHRCSLCVVFTYMSMVEHRSECSNTQSANDGYVDTFVVSIYVWHICLAYSYLRTIACSMHNQKVCQSYARITYWYNEEKKKKTQNLLDFSIGFAIYS